MISQEDYFVFSPEWNERYNICAHYYTVNAFCPIDGTELTYFNGINGASHLCWACGNHYSSTNNPKELKKEAKEFASGLEEAISEGDVLVKDLPQWQRIVDTARKKGIIK